MEQQKIVEPRSNLEAERWQEFQDYHESNPHVWKQFERFTIQLRHAGKTKYGAKSIMERVRWEEDTQNPGREFKINNNYTAFYARIFVMKYPDFEGFFEFREQK